MKSDAVALALGSLFRQMTLGRAQGVGVIQLEEFPPDYGTCRSPIRNHLRQ